jgi:hypothetical protein
MMMTTACACVHIRERKPLKLFHDLAEAELLSRATVGTTSPKMERVGFSLGLAVV